MKSALRNDLERLRRDALSVRHRHAFEAGRAKQPAIAAHATPDEVRAVQQAVRATIAPTDMVVLVRSMLPAVNPAQRAELLDTLRAGACPEVAAMFWSAARDVLTTDELAAVAGRTSAPRLAVAA